MRIADLCYHKGMLTKQVLIAKYPASEHFRYILLKHYLHTLSRNCDLVTMLPMEYLGHKYDKVWGHISELCTILLHTSAKQDYMVKWGKP